MSLQADIIESLKKRGYEFNDPYERIVKLLEESGELSQAVRNQRENVNHVCAFLDPYLIKCVKREAGDTGIVLECICKIYGFTLEEAMREKIEEDKERIK